MISLSKYVFERSLLDDDLDGSLDSGDVELAIAQGNRPGSDLRKYFGISEYVNNPFSLEVKGGKNNLRINLNDITSTNATRAVRVGKNNLKLKDLLGVDVNSMHVIGSLVLFNDSDILNSNIKNLTADSLNIEIPVVNDINFTIETVSNWRLLPRLTFETDGVSLKLNNVNLEMNTRRRTVLSIHGDLPIFNNVKSKTIQNIEISDLPSIVFSSATPGDIWGNAAWEKFFKFGKKFKCYNNGRTQDIKVRNMRTYESLVKSKTFYSMTCSEWPYTVKKRS